MQDAKREILAEVGRIATKPMNRFGSDLEEQQRTKAASFALLRSFGSEGHEVLRSAAGLGRYGCC